MTNSQATSNSTWLGAKLERLGEWFNPLLVKECRQSLKSRQFSTTFTLIVILSWMWSFYGVAMLGPDVAYRANGPEMFYGYYLILAFLLLIIVPYSAYRSLIAEREDNTFELVAITTLRPRQIIGGKLGSAVAQMVVYMSAIAPCLAFTYMLRGIDVLSICWILFYTALASLGFSLAALLMATIAKERHWQVIISVLIIIGLFSVFWGAVAWCYSVMRFFRLPLQSADFWIENFEFLTFYCGTFALLYFAAGAQLTAATENRSTILRVAMLFEQLLLLGWVGYEIAMQASAGRMPGSIPLQGSVALTAILSILFWYVMGSFMLGESPDLSARIKRGLPSSFLGRVFFTWFNPGPGTGYLFAVCNSMMVILIGALAVCYYAANNSQSQGPGVAITISLLALMWGYLAVYLGVGNLVLRLIRRVSKVTLGTAVMIQFLLILAGVGIPHFIRYLIDYRGSGYTLLHVTDPFWSCMEFADTRMAGMYVEPVRWIVLTAAVLILLLNLPLIAEEIRQVRVTTPKRVEEEEAALRGNVPVAQPQPTNPWN